MKILSIETATEICSVCLSINDTLLDITTDDRINSHSNRLTLIIEDILKRNGLNAKDLNAVAISHGPGSYTGLRIGAATAKGICYATGASLVSVSTLQHMALEAAEEKQDTSAIYCPMIDARRMEVYTGLYTSDNFVIKEPHSNILSNDSFNDCFQQNRIIFLGNGSNKAKNILDNNSRYIFFTDYKISAKSMITIALDKISTNNLENIFYYNPIYLK